MRLRPLAIATALLLTSSAAWSQAASGERLWTARPTSLRDLLVAPDAQSDSLQPLPGTTSVLFSQDGRISLGASISMDSESLATLPWCAEASGLLRIGALGRDCVAQGTVQMQLPGQIASASVAAQWHRDRFDVALAYGLSWVSPTQDIQTPLAPIGDVRLSPFAGQPLLPGMNAEAHSIAAGTQWRLTPESALQLNAALQALRLRGNYAEPALDLQQAMLGVGMSYGPFSGNVSGRYSRLDDPMQYPNTHWTGVDIGVSWRMPWRGELTVGARNLVSKTDPDAPPPRVLDETSERTPYVRYKQDL